MTRNELLNLIKNTPGMCIEIKNKYGKQYNMLKTDVLEEFVSNRKASSVNIEVLASNKELNDHNTSNSTVKSSNNNVVNPFDVLLKIIKRQ